MSARGIIFVATQDDRYVEEAILAARSAKRHAPHIPITLFTDRAVRPGECFDAIEKITGADVGDARANAMINRFTGLSRTPYERTLYLDTDAQVTSSDVATIFDLLDSCDAALVEDVPGMSHALAHTGRRMFNCGVILYRRAPAAAWLEPWRAAALRNLALAQETPVPKIPEMTAIADPAIRRWLLAVDKIALLGVLPPDRPQTLARLAILDTSWNFRGPVADGTVRIHHPHDRV